MTELNVVLAAHEAAAARHAADVEAVQSEHEAALDEIEKATEARQLQLIHEYDETLVRATPLICARPASFSEHAYAHHGALFSPPST